MASLPPELLQLIIYQVAHSHLALRTLRSLGLASWKLSNIASVHLFEQVQLYPTEDSYAKLIAIARHTVYRHYVRSLSIAPKATLGPFLDRDTIGRWFHHVWPPFIWRDETRYFRTVKKPTEEDRVIDFHHAEYTVLYENENRLHDKAGHLLKTAISCFSHLEAITPATHTYCSPFPVRSTVDALVSDLWHDAAYIDRYDFSHTAMIISAVAQGGAIANTQIDISKIFKNMEATVLHYLDLTASEETLFGNQKTLNFHFHTLDYSGLQQLLTAGKFKRFLGSLKMLETLTLSTFQLRRSSFPHVGLSDVFGNFTWPYLRRLDMS